MSCREGPFPHPALAATPIDACSTELRQTSCCCHGRLVVPSGSVVESCRRNDFYEACDAYMRHRGCCLRFYSQGCFAAIFWRRHIDNKVASPNLDPITKAPGAHPVGTGVGAAAGGVAAGAAVGTVAGPVGTVIGAAVGAVVGGLAGKGVAESIDPTIENAYWEKNYKDRPYTKANASYDDYGPAYGMGVDSFKTNSNARFEDVEGDMASRWNSQRGNSKLDWNDAKGASRDAWDRLKARM